MIFPGHQPLQRTAARSRASPLELKTASASFRFPVESSRSSAGFAPDDQPLASGESVPGVVSFPSRFLTVYSFALERGRMPREG